jgi:hypothetical protein
MQEPALARAPRHFVRMTYGPSIHKVIHFYSLLLYILAIELAIDDMATYYNQQLAILLFLLLSPRCRAWRASKRLIDRMPHDNQRNYTANPSTVVLMHVGLRTLARGPIYAQTCRTPLITSHENSRSMIHLVRACTSFINFYCTYVLLFFLNCILYVRST